MVVRTITIPVDMTYGRLYKLLSRGASYVGLGVVSLQDPDYRDLCDAYESITLAYRQGDFTRATMFLTKDFCIVRPDGIRLDRAEIDEQLQSRFSNHIQSDYREQPAHFVIRGNTARVASRVYGKSFVRRDGKIIEVEERGELISSWTKASGTWKRKKVLIRAFEQNTEWVTMPEDGAPVKQNKVKYLA